MKNTLLAMLLLLGQAAVAGPAVIWGSPYPIILGKGGIRFKNSDTATTCNAAAAGSLRYNAGTFEGCNGTTWTTLSGGGSGTVTSVAASVPAFLSIAGSPITTSGTLAISLSGTALPVANGGTGLTSAFTTGSVAFSNGSTLAQDNANLFWDDTNNRLGIDTSSPGSALDVKGTLRLSGATSGFVGLSPAAAAGSTSYTLPTADGASGAVLRTDGAALLSWEDPWFFQGTLDGATFALDSATNTTPHGIESSAITLVMASGSATGKVMCSGTQAASGTTCGGGASESFGVAFTPPTTGTYEVCADFAHAVNISSSDAILHTFGWVRTATNSQTIDATGNGKIFTYTANATEANSNSIHTCGIFSGLTGGTEYGFRVFQESTIVNVAITSNDIQGSGAFGAQITMTAKRLH